MVEEVGAGGLGFKKGDRVLISCITSCGKCDSCKRGMYSHCPTAAAGSSATDRRDAGRVRAYPVRRHQPPPRARGRRRGRARDAERHPPHRLRVRRAERRGEARATPSRSWAPARSGSPRSSPRSSTRRPSSSWSTSTTTGSRSRSARRHAGREQRRRQGRREGDGAHRRAGVDVAIEAVGIPATFDVCQDIVAAGGHVANVGVHGKPVSLSSRSSGSTTSPSPRGSSTPNTTPMLLKNVVADGCSPGSSSRTSSRSTT